MSEGVGEAVLHTSASEQACAFQSNALTQGEARLQQQQGRRGSTGGGTALHVACTAGAALVAQALLLNGADASRPDEWGLTPLEVGNNRSEPVPIS
jgi:hypothetical protein